VNVHELSPVQFWSCPSCQAVDKTHESGVTSRMHSCPALYGMTIPFVQVSDPDEKPAARHVVHESEDYIGNRTTTLAAISTERADGSNDLNVYPAAAVAAMNS